MSACVRNSAETLRCDGLEVYSDFTPDNLPAWIDLHHLDRFGYKASQRYVRLLPRPVRYEIVRPLPEELGGGHMSITIECAFAYVPTCSEIDAGGAVAIFDAFDVPLQPGDRVRVLE